MIALEVCVDTLDGARTAAAAGADRLELCAALELGGLTPSVGLMRNAARLGVPVHAMIRPRAGDFCFGPAEFEIMLSDIEAVRAAGLQGVALGVLNADGTLDREGLLRLVKRAEGLALTLHRAFDLVPDPFAALETAIALGFQRILTSGGAAAASDGAAQIGALHARAAGRIGIMPGAGVTSTTVRAIIGKTSITEVHASCRSRMHISDRLGTKFGFGDNRLQTDPRSIAALRETLADVAGLHRASAG